jgi:hypothetical protein
MLQSKDSGFGATRRPQLGEQSAHMIFDGKPTNVQLFGDLSVGQAISE